MEQEIWKDIPGYENIFMISNKGRIKSFKWNKEKIKKPYEGEKYLCVNLTKDGKRRHFKIHQLVAMAFLNHKPDGMNLIIDHINSDKKDNRPENLRIVEVRTNNSKQEERPKRFSSEYRGVHYDTRAEKWKSVIKIKGKRKHLGFYSTELEASEAYQKALSSLT